MAKSHCVDKRTLKRLDEHKFSDEERVLIAELLKEELVYEAALKEMQTKVEILREDFKRSCAYNPIEHVKIRIKQPSSILKKVYSRGLELNADEVRENINDLAGIRIVCTFKSDISRIADILLNSGDIEVLAIKDYITQPKESGYQSYHLIVNVPIHLIEGLRYCKVEVQIRTMAMDFWASLEHKIKYKYDGSVPKEIKGELFGCAKIANMLDDNMSELHKKVHG